MEREVFQGAGEALSLPRGRFAPSPSGEMHLGNAWASLLAWLSVKSQGGEMVLRLEDLDPQRCTPRYSQQVMDDLSWLGLTWVGEPMRQSERTSAYEEAFQILGKNHQVYPCYCTRGERMAASAPHAGEGQWYPGTCRVRPPTQQAVLARPASYRIQVPSEIVVVNRCLPQKSPYYTQNLQEDCGDFVLRRGDGVYAYQLAVVVDDFAMGVTEVVRGQDLRSSTPQQIWLGQQLGYPAMTYGHVPLLLAGDGRRLAKREGDLAISALAQRMTAEHLLGKLAKWAGLIQKEGDISAEELIPLFSWEKLPTEDFVVEDFL